MRQMQALARECDLRRTHHFQTDQELRHLININSLDISHRWGSQQPQQQHLPKLDGGFFNCAAPKQHCGIQQQSPQKQPSPHNTKNNFFQIRNGGHFSNVQPNGNNFNDVNPLAGLSTPLQLEILDQIRKSSIGMIDSPSNYNQLASPLSIHNSQQQTISSPKGSKSPNFKLPSTQFAPTLSRPSGIIQLAMAEYNRKIQQQQSSSLSNNQPSFLGISQHSPMTKAQSRNIQLKKITQLYKLIQAHRGVFSTKDFDISQLQYLTSKLPKQMQHLKRIKMQQQMRKLHNHLISPNGLQKIGDQGSLQSTLTISRQNLHSQMLYGQHQKVSPTRNLIANFNSIDQQQYIDFIESKNIYQKDQQGRRIRVGIQQGDNQEGQNISQQQQYSNFLPLIGKDIIPHSRIGKNIVSSSRRSPTVKKKGRKLQSPGKNSQHAPITGLGQLADQLNYKLYQQENQTSIKNTKIMIKSPQYKHLKNSKINSTIRLINSFLANGLKKRGGGQLDHNYVSKLAKALNLPITKQVLDKDPLLLRANKEFSGIIRQKLVNIWHQTINQSNGLTIQKKQQQQDGNVVGITHHVKFFVNKGNNHPTIRAILKKRWWYASVQSAADKDDASILWTVWKKQKILGKLPKLSNYIASASMGRQASDGSNTRPETTNSLDEENKSTSAASSCGLNTPLRSNRKLKTERDQMLCSFTEKNINNSASQMASPIKLSNINAVKKRQQSKAQSNKISHHEIIEAKQELLSHHKQRIYTMGQLRIYNRMQGNLHITSKRAMFLNM